ncbi:MAG: hypothetical protein RLZZ399_770 [Verrucomicrobiota bacterium]|jgi:hypothetical protein
MRSLAADLHPDHDTLCTFRRQNGTFIAEAFRGVLLMACELKLLTVGMASLGGTKVLANPSKHKVVSYQCAAQQITILDAEVEALLQKAESADASGLADGLTTPGELHRRHAQRAKLAEARRIIEERVRERTAQ